MEEDSGTWTPFLNGEENHFSIDLEDGGRADAWGEEMTTCYADWGGWRWEAWGGDRVSASGRLADRLRRKNPFMGVDWGEAGILSGNDEDLDPTIPENIRKRMVEYHNVRERYEQELFRLSH
jgi:hypothetical protein